MNAVFCTLPSHDHMMFVIEETPHHHFVVHGEVAVHELTPAQKAEYDASLDEAKSYEVFCEAYGDGPPPHKFASVDDALDFAVALAVLDGIQEELSAFNAPSECAELAYAAPQAALDAALAKSIGH